MLRDQPWTIVTRYGSRPRDPDRGIGTQVRHSHTPATGGSSRSLSVMRSLHLSRAREPALRERSEQPPQHSGGCASRWAPGHLEEHDTNGRPRAVHEKWLSGGRAY